MITVQNIAKCFFFLTLFASCFFFFSGKARAITCVKHCDECNCYVQLPDDCTYWGWSPGCMVTVGKSYGGSGNCGSQTNTQGQEVCKVNSESGCGVNLYDYCGGHGGDSLIGEGYHWLGMTCGCAGGGGGGNTKMYYPTTAGVTIDYAGITGSGWLPWTSSLGQGIGGMSDAQFNDLLSRFKNWYISSNGDYGAALKSPTYVTSAEFAANSSWAAAIGGVPVQMTPPASWTQMPGVPGWKQGWPQAFPATDGITAHIVGPLALPMSFDSAIDPYAQGAEIRDRNMVSQNDHGVFDRVDFGGIDYNGSQPGAMSGGAGYGYVTWLTVPAGWHITQNTGSDMAPPGTSQGVNCHHLPNFMEYCYIDHFNADDNHLGGGIGGSWAVVADADSVPPTCAITGPATTTIVDSPNYVANVIDKNQNGDNGSLSSVSVNSSLVTPEGWTQNKNCTTGFSNGAGQCATLVNFSTPGDYYVSCTATDGSGNTCTGVTCGASGRILVHVTQPNPWWQVKDSDVVSSGDLTSMVSVGSFFNLNGPGGFPGVAAYGGGTDLTTTKVSSTGWLTNSGVTNAKVFSYNSFAKMIPEDILTIINQINIVDVSGSLTSGGVQDSNGYYWYKYDGAVNSSAPLTIPTTNIGDRKVIVMVDNADLNITGNISLNDGTGFFMVVVNGKITVDATVGGGSPDLMGIYFSDGVFDDSLGGTKLSVKGSVAANGGITMQRDLRISGGDNDTPAEYFEYDPSQIMLFPKVFGTHQMRWKEVAP